MKQLLLTLTLMSAIGCNAEPYNGKKAIFASIENSAMKKMDLIDEADNIVSEGRAEIRDIITQREEENDFEGYLYFTSHYSCQSLMSSAINNPLELLGEDGISAMASLRIAQEEAEKVDFSNEQEVNKAINKIDDSLKKLQFVFYSINAKVSQLFHTCISTIKPEEN